MAVQSGMLQAVQTSHSSSTDVTQSLRSSSSHASSHTNGHQVSVMASDESHVVNRQASHGGQAMYPVQIPVRAPIWSTQRWSIKAPEGRRGEGSKGGEMVDRHALPPSDFLVTH